MGRESDTSLATIVSIFPRRLVEVKPGLNPAEYVIPAGSVDNPSMLIIEDNVYYLMDSDPLSDSKIQSKIKVPVRPIELAQSIIMDYVSALISVESNKMPGLFAVKGGYDDPKLVKARFHQNIQTMNEVQISWFQALVLMADEIWAKTRAPHGISDLQREACRQLHIEREWLISAKPSDMVKCKFCTMLVNSDAVICPSCRHVINPEKYKAMNPISVG
jgi:hypothetical protein